MVSNVGASGAAFNLMSGMELPLSKRAIHIGMRQKAVDLLIVIIRLGL